MALLNGQPLGTTVCTHFEPNVASICQKFTPSLSLSLASKRILNSEKKKIEIQKSEL